MGTLRDFSVPSSLCDMLCPSHSLFWLSKWQGVTAVVCNTTRRRCVYWHRLSGFNRSSCLSRFHVETQLYHVAVFFAGPEAHSYRAPQPPRLPWQAVPLACPLGRVLQYRLLSACLISTKFISEKSAWGFKLLLQLIRYCFTDWVVPSERWAAIYFPCPLLKFKLNCKTWLFDCLVQSRDCFAQGIDIHLYANAELIWALLNGYHVDDKDFVQMPFIRSIWKVVQTVVYWPVSEQSVASSCFPAAREKTLLPPFYWWGRGCSKFLAVSQANWEAENPDHRLSR